MRRAALALLALPLTGAACGASSPTATAPSCAATARRELVAVAHRIYDQAVRGPNEVAAVARVEHSAALARAVAARDPRAIRAARAAGPTSPAGHGDSGATDTGNASGTGSALVSACRDMTLGSSPSTGSGPCADAPVSSTGSALLAGSLGSSSSSGSGSGLVIDIAPGSR